MPIAGFACSLVVAIATLATAASAGATAPAVVGTKDFPGREPVALGFYQAGNKLLVSEDNEGKLHILDGTTLQTRKTLTVGGSAYEIVVDEASGKAYVASDVRVSIRHDQSNPPQLARDHQGVPGVGCHPLHGGRCARLGHVHHPG